VDSQSNPISDAELNFDVPGVCYGIAIIDTFGNATFDCSPVQVPHTINVQYAGDQDSYLLDSTVTGTLSVQTEKAKIEFSDNNQVAIPVEKPGGDSGTFSLQLMVKEKLIGIPEESSAPRDISLAEISLSLSPVEPGGTISGNYSPIEVTSEGYDAVLTVDCEFNDIPVNTYTIEVIVNGGYYAGYNEDVLVVYGQARVSQPVVGNSIGLEPTRKPVLATQ
jgi:hypothetical protein